jgi:hypothetical protein
VTVRTVALLAVLSCSDRRSEQRAVRAPPVEVASANVHVDAGVPDAIVDPRAALRDQGFARAVEIIEQRVAQRAPKMRLSDDQGLAAARALLALADRESFRALHAVMPRSTVELARAVAERGVAVDEAETIARYLVRVVDALAFERLQVFDDNHSHVTGREWHEIDYSGEGMTWQQQKADWTKQGVENFKTARSIHAYFVGAERLPHWKRVYRPRGTMSAVTPPASVDHR